MMSLLFGGRGLSSPLVDMYTPLVYKTPKRMSGGWQKSNSNPTLLNTVNCLITVAFLPAPTHSFGGFILEGSIHVLIFQAILTISYHCCLGLSGPVTSGCFTRWSGVGGWVIL